VPGQPGGPGQAGVPDQGGQQYGYPSEGVTAPPPGSPMQGRAISPVNEIETRVTGRRVVQYIIDHLIVGIVWSFLFWVLDRGSGAVLAILQFVAFVLAVAWGFFYWVYRPYAADGQTFGMQLMGVRVISKDGGRASLVQLLIRAIFLIVDEFPFLFLVGFITVICSRYRQRVGDHAAKTLVVRAQMRPVSRQREYAGAGQAGFR
jgi:uncharacterized RDD family membrane protein YckC